MAEIHCSVCFERVTRHNAMSVQLGILYILASRENGFATIASINADVRMLSGPDWSRKLRSLAARTRPINLFSDGFVTRDNQGWRITDAGRQFIESLEALPADAGLPALRLVESKAAAFSRTEPRAPLALVKRA